MKYITVALLALSLTAIKPMDGALAQGEVQRSTFIQAPSLISTNTSDRSTNEFGSTYSFQIAVPQQIGSSLQKLTISQKDAIEPIAFSADRTTVYIQQPSGALTPVSNTATIDPNSRAISVVLDTPVPAGTTVIVGVRPVSNPSLEGQYVFGLTSFPSSESSQGQFIGLGRLDIYNKFDNVGS